MVILICGFTGCGKSTLLKMCRDGGVNTIDLDEKICQDLSIKSDQLGEFIRREGFERFRQLEERALGEICDAQSNKNILVALGGGCRWHSLVDRSRVKSLWLDTTFETCYQRISGDSNRPLADLTYDQLYSLYMERVVEYRLADRRISSSEVDFEQISQFFVTLSPDIRSQKV